MQSFSILILLTICIFGCHVRPAQTLSAWDSYTEDQQREALVLFANQLAGMGRYRVDDRKFSYDCSGFIGGILYREGIDVFKGASELQMRGNGVRLLYEFTQKYGYLFKNNPQPGDLIFFSNTYDRNRDRKNNDLLTHVGLVERVDSDGTITFIHHLNARAQRDRMNFMDLSKNSYLRQRRRRDPPHTRYRSSQLFQSFGTLVSLTESPQSSTSVVQTK